MDPLFLIKRLSGIGTVSVFTKENKRIVLLGDVHTQAQLCTSCRKPDCYSVAGFIRALAEYSVKSKTQFDFFGEFYAPFRDDINGKEMVRIANLEMKSDADKDKLLFQLRKEFAREVYLHGSKKSSQRYHYVDVRVAPFVQAKGIGLLLRAQIPDYARLIQATTTRSAFSKIILDLCLKPSSNKIFKQYHKLPLGQRKQVRAWLESRVWVLNRFRWSFETFIFWMEALLLDFYAICRFLRYFAYQPAGSTSVFFAGAGHTLSIGQFITLWGAQKLLSTQPTERLDVLVAGMEKAESKSRCVRLDMVGKIS